MVKFERLNCLTSKIWIFVVFYWSEKFRANDQADVNYLITNFIFKLLLVFVFGITRAFSKWTKEQIIIMLLYILEK